MITITINEKPIVDAKKFVEETAGAALGKLYGVKEKGAVVVNHIKEMIDLSPAKSAYYSSIAANLSSYAFGFDSFSNFLFIGTEIFSLNAHVRQAEKGQISSEEKKLANTARANLAINLFTSLFDLPAVKFVATVYNCLSDYIQVSVKN